MAISDARRKANERHLSKLDDIKVRVPKGSREVIKGYAESNGKSLNSYIVDLIKEDMKKAGHSLE